MKTRSETVLAAAAAVNLVLLGTDLFLLERTGLETLRSLLPFPSLSLVICLVGWFRCRLLRLADQERQDIKLAEGEAVSASLFEQDNEPAAMSTARTQAQFEKMAMPAFAPLLAVIEGFWAWHLFKSFPQLVKATPQNLLLAAALLGGQAFILFLFSRFLLGLARNRDHIFLRGPGIMLGVSCLGTILVAATAMVGERMTGSVLPWAGWILTGVLAVMAVEHVLNFLGELYRPRRGASISTAYESRIGGLLTDPASWVNNMAQALDYQFGFNVSHTWFYRFLSGALLPLLLFQLTVLYLLSCMVFIGPEEKGILERFGKPLPPGQELNSGAHFKWPWPFETVQRFPAKRILTVHIGHEPDRSHDPDGPVLWSQHTEDTEDLFLVASASEQAAPGDASTPNSSAVAVSLLTVHFPVEYTITNVHHYAFSHADPEQVLEEIAHRSFSLQAAGSDLFGIMGTGQEKSAARLRQHIQQTADALQLGVEIVFIGMQGVHPPSAVVPAFESVIGAREEKEAIILEALTYAAKEAPLARARSEALKIKAAAYRKSRSALAAAETERFKQQIKGYQAAPRVYTTRGYLRTLRDTIGNTRKFIVAADNADSILQFNFEEKINPDLFDLGTTEGLEK